MVFLSSIFVVTGIHTGKHVFKKIARENILAHAHRFTFSLASYDACVGWLAGCAYLIQYVLLVKLPYTKSVANLEKESSPSYKSPKPVFVSKVDHKFEASGAPFAFLGLRSF